MYISPSRIDVVGVRNHREVTILPRMVALQMPLRPGPLDRLTQSAEFAMWALSFLDNS